MKTELRIKANNIRKSLEISEISKTLVELIRVNPLYNCANKVMIFYPKKDEIDLKGLLNDNKEFYLPRVCGDFLEVCPYKLGDELVKSKFGVLEPITSAVNPDMLDLIFVPALMLDRKGFRLGYGGGYYDKLLSSISNNIKTICALPESLIVDSLPTENCDIAVQEIISI